MAESVSPAGSGGFGDCWKGTFLGNIAVAMKCSRSDVKADVAMRVSLHFHTDNIYMTYMNRITRGLRGKWKFGGACDTQMFCLSSGLPSLGRRCTWYLHGWRMAI